MSTLVRPTFNDGQYVAAADLEAILAYARALKTAHDLGSHSWGVTTGLDLVERPGLGGTIECWLTSGHAVDGLGRSLILRSAKPVGTALLQALPSGAWFVWIGQRARAQGQIRPAYGICNDVDAFGRISEDAEISVTGMLPLTERQSGVSVAGTTRPDARLARRLFQPDGPFELDGSVPEQDEHPLGLRARWLVPLGLVGWDQAEQRVRPLSEPEKKGARLLRRQAGAVAEEILAPGGLLRLRDRRTFVAAGQADNSVEALAAQMSPTAADLDLDGENVRFKEFLWVEGHTRQKGDVRLFAGKLEWRDAQGGSPQGAAWLGRVSTASGDGESLFCLGAKADASPMSRLVVGPLDGTDILPALSVGSNMRVGIGTRMPALSLDIRGDFGSLSGPVTAHFGSANITGAADGQLTVQSGNNVVRIGEKDHRVGINVLPAPANALHVVGTVQVDGTGKLRLLGSEFLDAGDGILRIRSGGGIVSFDGADKVGINTIAPAADLALDVGGAFGCSTGQARMRLLGSEILDPGDGVLRIRSGGGIVSFDGADKVGINTQAPAADLVLDVNGAFGCSTGQARMRLLGSELVDAGDGILRMRSGGGTVAFDGTDRVGIGTVSPAYELDVTGNARVTGTFRCLNVLSLSDRRLKHSIAPITSPLDLALSLRGVSFRWAAGKAGTGGQGATHFGFVADEVEDVLPDWVEADPDGTKYVRTADIGALLVEATRVLDGQLKEAREEIRKLSARVTKLESAKPVGGRRGHGTDAPRD